MVPMKRRLRRYGHPPPIATSISTFSSTASPPQCNLLLGRRIGGRAWTSVKLKSAKQEKALVEWGNTSMGLLLHWYHANKQQSGRGNVVRTSLDRKSTR